jgi:hypothetical protein
MRADWRRGNGDTHPISFIKDEQYATDNFFAEKAI